jgi:succinate dehydrogenase (ubiquinone) membrane anchor subunit
MAAASRSSLLRQAQLVTSSRRLFTTSSRLSHPVRLAPLLSARSPRSTILTQTAPFSTTPSRKILPAGPQVIQGGVNDPAPIPKADPLHGSYHWTFERALSIALVPLTIAPFAAGSLSPVWDAALIFGIIIHSHAGFQYVPRSPPHAHSHRIKHQN